MSAATYHPKPESKWTPKERATVERFRSKGFDVDVMESGDVRITTRKIWKPESAGDSVIGIFCGFKAGEYKGKPTRQGIVKDAEGVAWLTPNHTILLNQLDCIEIGSEITVEFTGVSMTKKEGQSPAKTYTVTIAAFPEMSET
jgi:hypothetical protein